MKKFYAYRRYENLGGNFYTQPILGLVGPQVGTEDPEACLGGEEPQLLAVELLYASHFIESVSSYYDFLKFKWSQEDRQEGEPLCLKIWVRLSCELTAAWYIYLVQRSSAGSTPRDFARFSM